jgi:SAM-dependent methyltransferase
VRSAARAELLGALLRDRAAEPQRRVAELRDGPQSSMDPCYALAWLEVCSADDLPFGDATFDSISVRFGYMFFPDVAKATAQFARVLKPGGRLCSSVWVKPEENPWTTIATQAIATEAVLAPPDLDGPNMFRCAAPGYVSALYETAGLRDVAEWDVEVELVTRSPEQYWKTISEHVSLAVAALQQVDGPARERIRAHAIAEVSAFEKDGKVPVPGVARCIVGTK